MSKSILCLDFDGVIHSYKSGWQGARNIPDPPNKGALVFIADALERFEVHIYSSRSHAFLGRRAMRRWLKDAVHCELLRLIEDDAFASPSYRNPLGKWLKSHMRQTMEPIDEVIDWSAGRFVKAIKWPKYKPPALVAIDDRAICFTGEWPSIHSLAEFKPWNK